MGITTEGYVCISTHKSNSLSFRRTLFPSLLPVKTISSSSYTWHPQIVTDVMPDHFSAKFSSPFCSFPPSPLTPFFFFFFLTVSPAWFQ